MTGTAHTSLWQGWLADMPVCLAEALLSQGIWHDYRAGDVIYHVGSEDRSLWGLASGTVRMWLATNEHEARFGHAFGPGFWFGEYELVTRHPRLIEMEVAEATRAICIPASRIERLTHEQPQLWRWIAVLAAQHTLLAVSACDGMMLRNPVSRTAAQVLRLSGRRAAHPHDVMPITQQNLAEVLNLSRSSTGRILRQFEKDGLISLEYGAIVLRDADAMAGLI